MDRKKIFKGVLKTTLIAGAIALVFSLLLVYVIPFSLALVWGDDIAKVDDSRFDFVSTAIPKDKNMYYKLLKIDKIGVYNPTKLELHKNFLNIKKFNQETLVNLFSKNQEALKNFSIAASLDSYQNPYLLDSSKVGLLLSIVPFNAARIVSQVSLLRSLWLISEGHEREAVVEAYNSLQIGEAMMKNNVTTTEYLVGMTMYKNAMLCFQKIIPEIEDEKLLTDTFEKIKAKEITINDSYLKTEYLYSKKSLELVASGELGLYESYVNRRAMKNKYYYKQNLTLSYYVDDFGNLLDNLNKDCSAKEIISQKVNFDFNSLADFPKLYFTKNAMGKILAIPVNAALANVETKRCELKLEKTLTGIEFSKKLFELDNGKQPESLKDLVPNYLNELPINPLTGKELTVEKGVE